MNNKPRLVVMLTLNDKTVENAYEVFDKCKDSKAQCFGFKEQPLTAEEMKKLFSYMKKCNKKTFLEVVEYTEEEGLRGAELAAECECNALMGTVYFDSINEYCKAHNLEYYPFVGEVSERPSVLEGDADSMIEEAKRYLEKGVSGIDFLGYRYTGDCFELNKKFVESINAPVCIAGSVDSFERLDEIIEISPYSFTVGGAFFNNIFGGDFTQQINRVCDYIENGGNDV